MPVLNCTVLYAMLDVVGWGCNLSYTAQPMDRAGHISKCVLLRVPAADVHALYGVQREWQPQLVYANTGWSRGEDRRELDVLSLVSSSIVPRWGACPWRRRHIFVSDLLPSRPRPPVRMVTVEDKTDHSPCRRLRTAASVVESIRALNANGFSYCDWKMSQWGFDVTGRAVLVDVGGACRPAEYETRLVGRTFDLGCRSRTNCCTSYPGMAELNTRMNATARATARNGLWKIHQSIMLLCLVQSIAPAAGDTFAGLRTTVWNDSLAGPSPTSALVSAIQRVLKRHCDAGPF